MSPATCELTGVIRGQTIELTTPPGLPDGTEVIVVIKPKPEARVWGLGILRSAGVCAEGLSDEASLDDLMKSRRIRYQRTGE